MKYQVRILALAVLLVALPTPSSAGLARVDDQTEYASYQYQAEDGTCIALPERIDPDEIFLGVDCAHLKKTLVTKVFASFFQNGSDLEAEPIVEVELYVNDVNDKRKNKKLYYTKYQGGYPPFLTYDDRLFNPLEKAAK